MLILVFLLLTCSTRNKPEDKFKSLPFAVTGSADAIPAFQKGLLLLHNFEYDDAAEAFSEAQKTDPGFVMAYWGEAMTYNHPVWRSQDAAKAREALNKLGETAEERTSKVKSALEGDFLKAIEILYGEGSKEDRDRAYSDHLNKMYERYPGNHEVAAFYALSLLGIKEGWNKDLNLKGAEIAEGILKENPTHPGALHYLIHSDDHPEYARLALAAANEYGGVASYAGHALHMPSHIYLALGMWDDVVRSNEVSWQAGVDRKVNKNLSNNALNYHGHWWLEYGYLQQGRHTLARQLLENQIRYTNELPAPRARVHLLYMKGHYLVETNDWSGEVPGISIETKDLSIVLRSISRLLEGTQAFQKKNRNDLDVVIGSMQKDLESVAQQKLVNNNIAVCGAESYANSIPSEGEFAMATIIGMELKGMSSWLKKDMVDAEKWFKEAAALEDKLGYFFGPPDILKPTHEMLGEFFLVTDRPQEADEQFELALLRAPNRVLSLQGQLQAAKQNKDVKKTEELEKRLTEILKKGDAPARKNV